LLFGMAPELVGVLDELLDLLRRLGRSGVDLGRVDVERIRLLLALAHCPHCSRWVPPHTLRRRPVATVDQPSRSGELRGDRMGGDYVIGIGTVGAGLWVSYD